ncbi:MAG: DUF2752 domain-containing protein [Bacteroidetes bacterium]|nr:DUF2752 domain-containing protein [Bacteroidota bacterium]
MRLLFFYYNEAIFWSLSFIAIYFLADPASTLPSLCVFHWLGWENCWGCGLARSIHQALHGHFISSWELHKLGIPAIFILSTRVLSLVKRQRPKHDQLYAVATRSST